MIALAAFEGVLGLTAVKELASSLEMRIYESGPCMSWTRKNRGQSIECVFFLLVPRNQNAQRDESNRRTKGWFRAAVNNYYCKKKEKMRKSRFKKQTLSLS